MTVPILIPFCVSVGAGVALVGHAIHQDYPLWKAPGLWAVVAFVGLVVTPAGAYFLWRFPDWSIMYLADSQAWSFEPVTLAASYPVAATGAFLLSRALILRRRLTLVWGVLSVGIVTTSLALFLGWGALSVLGSTEDFRVDNPQMREFFDTPLPFVTVGAAVLWVIGLGAALWRVALLGRKSAAATIEVSPSMVLAEPSAPKKGGAVRSGHTKKLVR